MKKIIPFIFPLITGLFGGWFIECFLCVASITMSPFGDLDQFNFFLFCGIVSLVSLLIIIVATIVNISFFIELSNKKKCMLGLYDDFYLFGILALRGTSNQCFI